MTITPWDPPRNPTSATWRMIGNTQTHESPFDRSTQTIEMPGARWAGTWTWDTLPETQWRYIAAFLAWARGRRLRFALNPLHAPLQTLTTGTGGMADDWAINSGGKWLLNDGSGAWSSAESLATPVPLVDGGGQVGEFLHTDGWIPDEPTLQVGDFLSFQDPAGRYALHMVVYGGPYVADSIGRCTFAIAPPIRRSPNDNAPVEIVTPRGTFMLAADDGGDMDFRLNRKASLTIEFVEALV